MSNDNNSAREIAKKILNSNLETDYIVSDRISIIILARAYLELLNEANSEQISRLFVECELAEAMDEIYHLKQDVKDLKPWPDDYRELVTQNEALRKENDTLIHNSELEAAAHMDTLAKLEKSIAALQVQTEQATILARIDNKYVEALNKIGMLGMSEHAYTSEFTERVRSIITEALK